LGGAEAEYGAAQRRQAREFELEADQEQQTTPSSDTVMMVSGARTKANPYRADHHARGETSDDGGEPE
jgi:hypothetical protein